VGTTRLGGAVCTKLLSPNPGEPNPDDNPGPNAGAKVGCKGTGTNAFMLFWQNSSVLELQSYQDFEERQKYVPGLVTAQSAVGPPVECFATRPGAYQRMRNLGVPSRRGQRRRRDHTPRDSTACLATKQEGQTLDMGAMTTNNLAAAQILQRPQRETQAGSYCSRTAAVSPR